MRKLLYAIMAGAALAAAFQACNSSSEDTWEKYADWRETNSAWFESLRDSLDADGKLYYTVVYPDWNPQAEVLVHYFNDRAETAGNLSPLYNSTCDIMYYGRLYNSTPFDSSYLKTTYGRGIARFRPDQMIEGVGIALMDMRVGDTLEVVVPYPLAYGSGTAGVILPYSALRFNIGLRDIPYYEIPEP